MWQLSVGAAFLRWADFLRPSCRPDDYLYRMFLRHVGDISMRWADSLRPSCRPVNCFYRHRLYRPHRPHLLGMVGCLCGNGTWSLCQRD
jgi:hypothetical protein